MPKIKHYENKPFRKPNTLFRLTELTQDGGTVDLVIDGTIYDVRGLILQDMEVQYSQELEQGKEVLLFFEDATEIRTYHYDKKLKQWLLKQVDNGYTGGRD